VIRVLRKELGTDYNKKHIIPNTLEAMKRTDRSFFGSSRNLFLHGLLTGDQLGTCSSLPVLTVAVGRRLGYPLKLVAAKNHLFVRWVDENTTFNIESTGQGVTMTTDSYYRRWPFSISDEEMASGIYLKSMTFEEELAAFLFTRGRCLMTQQRHGEARLAFQRALQLDIKHPAYRIGFTEATHRIIDNQQHMFESGGLP
jgi:regulator of sirC expression with transglutaminase-like and TPR domain